jgi:hypothetical protein
MYIIKDIKGLYVPIQTDVNKHQHRLIFITKEQYKDKITYGMFHHDPFKHRHIDLVYQKGDLIDTDNMVQDYQPISKQLFDSYSETYDKLRKSKKGYAILLEYMIPAVELIHNKRFIEQHAKEMGDHIVYVEDYSDAKRLYTDWIIGSIKTTQSTSLKLYYIAEATNEWSTKLGLLDYGRFDQRRLIDEVVVDIRIEAVEEYKNETV